MNKGIFIHNVSDEAATVFRGRSAFADDYCTQKGWSRNARDLSIDQIMEITGQDGWKNPAS